jgi:diguanylate cyclase (GGDEF)-like protein
MNERLHVLIVEDNPADVDLMRDALPETGPIRFHSESVPRLSEALARLAIGGIDLVMTDLGLPDSRGLATFRTLRQAAPDLAIIVLTGNDDQEMAVAAVREGAQDFLIKGQISGNQLMRAVRYAIERKRTEKEIRLLNAELEQLALTDYLTNLYNRRYFMQRGAEEFKRVSRYSQPLALLMLDIDEFKKINDTNGHEAGDLALQRVAAALKSSLREIDILGRIGGEEFAVLLPNTLLPAAVLLAERIRQSIANMLFQKPDGAWIKTITISIGVATFTDEMSGIDDLLRNADAALYSAKNSGRNCVRVYDEGKKERN